MAPESGTANLPHALQVAVEAARRGGQVALDRLGDPGYRRWKGHRDVVCEASLHVQDTIVSLLQEEMPDSEVLAEEGPEDAPVPIDAPLLWIVDPICGSLNYSRGIPHFAVSIALRAAGAIQVSVVFDPCTGDLFEATVETPATLNGRKIFVEHDLEGNEAWGEAVLGSDWPRGGQRRKQARLIIDELLDQVCECNLMGSPALGICNVAAGRLHAYWHLDLRIWDIAAASLILERAGGLFTNIQGSSWLFSDGGYIASNHVIHGWAQDAIRAVLSEELFDPARVAGNEGADKSSA